MMESEFRGGLSTKMTSRRWYVALRVIVDDTVSMIALELEVIRRGRSVMHLQRIVFLCIEGYKATESS